MSYRSSGLRTHFGHAVLWVVHLLFGVWGVVVLALHIQASMRPQLLEFALQVHPWGISKAACYLAVLDRHRLAISGTEKDVAASWNKFDRSTVVALVIRHCPALEIPDTFTEFHHVTNVNLYNSSIRHWDESAALTNTNHPKVVWLYVIRVNMTDGVLPAGLQSSDFPLTLQDIEFCYTNLRDLPDDLDTKWLLGSIVFIEHSQFTTIPPVLMRLEPYYLSVTGNPINELPPEIFKIPGLMYLIVGEISALELPRTVTSLSPMLLSIYLTNSDVSFFWSWINPLVSRNEEFGEPSLFMGGSAYCVELEKIVSGEAQAFSASPSSDYSDILMDPSDANRDVILSAVRCDNTVSATFYPIDIEDGNSAIS